MGILIIGVMCVVASAVLTREKWRDEGIPPELAEYTAGTGIVPRWVSLINLIGWGAIIIGVFILVFGK